MLASFPGFPAYSRRGTKFIVHNIHSHCAAFDEMDTSESRGDHLQTSSACEESLKDDGPSPQPSSLVHVPPESAPGQDEVATTADGDGPPLAKRLQLDPLPSSPAPVGAPSSTGRATHVEVDDIHPDESAFLDGVAHLAELENGESLAISAEFGERVAGLHSMTNLLNHPLGYVWQARETAFGFIHALQILAFCIRTRLILPPF